MKYMTRVQKNAAEYPKFAAIDIFMRILVGIAAVTFVFTALLLPVRVVSNGMSPMLNDGEIVLVSAVSKHLTRPKRGEAVLYNNNTHQQRIARIIANPGDTVVVQLGRVYINDQYLDESTYRIGGDILEAERFTVPDGCVYVMWDDRREEGCTDIVAYDDIIGVVRMRIFPLDRVNFFGVG